MSIKFGCGVVASAFVLAGALGVSPAVANDLKFPDYGGARAQSPASFSTSWARPTSLFTPFIGVEAGISGSNASFDVVPSFDVGGVTGVVGVNGGVWFRPSELDALVGLRTGVLFGLGSNSISHPGGSTFDYLTKYSWMTYYEGIYGFQPRIGSERSRMILSLGAATTHTIVTGTSPGFSVESGNTVTGITTSAAYTFPITRSVDLSAQLRYAYVPTDTHLIPGPVPISSNLIIVTMGATMSLDAP